MNELEKQLLQEEVGANEPTLVVRTRTTVDAGRWWRRTPLWLCVVGDELLILAVARRRYVAHLALRSRPETHYCHTTGELVIDPNEDLTHARFRVTPRQALALLNAMGIPQGDSGVAAAPPAPYESLEPTDATAQAAPTTLIEEQPNTGEEPC